MIDHKKRTTLKGIIASGTIVLTPSVFVKAAASNSSTFDALQLKVEHDTQFGSNYLVVENLSDKDAKISFSKTDTIQLPHGVFSLEHLGKFRSITIQGNRSRIFNLGDWRKEDLGKTNHLTLGLPLQHHVVADHITLKDELHLISTLKPIYFQNASMIA